MKFFYRRCAPRLALLAVMTASVSVLLACGGSQSQPEDGSAAKVKASACGDYARALCVELGPESDGCRSALGVVTLLSPRACALAIEDFEHSRERIAALRGACEQVATRVCAEMGDESDSCQGIREDLPKIPPGHCAALLRDQDRLIAALHERQASTKPLSEEAWRSLLAGTPPGFGAADAQVVVVEFSDFECPYCAEAAATVHKLREHYGDRIRFVFRNYPLPFHPNARAAAQASLAAHEQGKFWELHDRLFEHQDALGNDQLIEHARAAGLDVEAFRTAATGAASGTRVDEDMRLGQLAHVQGTPTMFINKQRVQNPLDFDEVSEQVDAALKN
jgi:protein-disulfide isomerase